MSECTIIIPCYNEAERLDTSSFASFMDRYPDIAFLFVNDGSTDRTRDVLIRLCAARPNASFWELAENSGKAEAVRQGILKAAESESCGNFIGVWDADLSTSLEEIPRFLACARPGIWMVSGCRLRRLGGHVERSLIRHILGRSFATIISNYLDLPVYDTQCGAKLYAREEITRLVIPVPNTPTCSNEPGQRCQAKPLKSVKIDRISSRCVMNILAITIIRTYNFWPYLLAFLAVEVQGTFRRERLERSAINLTLTVAHIRNHGA